MEKFQIYFFTALFLAVLLIAFFVYLPFLVPLSIAATLAVLFHPLNQRIERTMRLNRSISALITVFIAIVILFLPLAFMGTIVVGEARQLVATEISNGGSDSIARFAPMIETYVKPFFPGFSINIATYTRFAADWLVQNLGSIFSSIVQATISLLLSILAFYYLLRDGAVLTETIVALSPLPDTHDHQILAKLERAIHSVIRGTLMVSVIQGIVAGIGFAIFGVPNPALFGSFAAITALIPGVGTSLVVVPAILYLFFSGFQSAAIGLIIWGGIAVGLIDNMLAPMIMKRGMHVHSFLVLLAVLGGLKFFGPFGFLLGPLVLSLLFAMIEIYRALIDSDGKSFAGL